MSDLIRREDVIKLVNQFVFGLCKDQNDEVRRIFNKYIEKMPTAYDINNVVEELEQKKEEVQRMRNTCVALSDLEVCDIENVTYERAIEIVKQGGVSDDMCEWKYSDSEYYWESSCEHLHIFMSDGPKENEYDFCPYCGKKIKIVGDLYGMV